MTERELGFLCEHFTGEELEAAKARVEAGEPLGYVIGEWYFWDHAFKLNRETLIPRPDTEHLVERAIKELPDGAYFADLGTGSGCIAISVLAARPDCAALLCDLSAAALDCARENACAIGVADRCEFLCADMTAPLPGDAVFDAILSNPPYIKTSVIPTLSPQVRREPRAALDGGEDGLDFYRAIFDLHAPRVKEGGAMIFEIGYDQANDLRALASRHGWNCEIFRDYGGNDRVAYCKRI